MHSETIGSKSEKVRSLHSRGRLCHIVLVSVGTVDKKHCTFIFPITAIPRDYGDYGD